MNTEECKGCGQHRLVIRGYCARCVQDENWAHTYTARAQALVEALADYEAAHPDDAPCFDEPLALMRGEMEP